MLPLWLSLFRKHKEWENVFCCEGCKQSFLLNQISNCDIGDIKLPEGIEQISKRELLRIGLAGLCFSNIMMFSFQDYLAADGIEETVLKNTFNYISLLPALPIIFYAAAPFFI